MNTVICSGTPYEIGYQHGQQAKEQIHGSLFFYTALFKKNAGLEWKQVRDLATKFVPSIEQKWPSFLEEMRGLADGSLLEMADILALNVRTEISFGMFNDGCTALSWKTDNASYLAQNWDWMNEQKANLIPIIIKQQGKPTIRMITEAGIIGKIGFNTSGVGVCLNAIRARGMSPEKLPCHLGLRLVLESESCSDAVRSLEKYGIASACHMLVADATTSIGLEWSSIDLQKLETNNRQQIFHSNHYLVQHPGVIDTVWLKDSPFRVSKVERLCEMLPADPIVDQIASVFEDEDGFPSSICRFQTAETGSETLFNIVMELKRPTAFVRFGRPSALNEKYQFPE